MTEPIKLVVTRERFEEIISIDDSMHFLELNNKEMYEYMCQFVVNGNDSYLSVEDARKKFKTIPRKEFQAYITQFMKAVGEAFVNPPNGAVSEEPS